MNRQERVKVAEETLRILDKGEYQLRGKTYKLENIKSSIYNTAIHKKVDADAGIGEGLNLAGVKVGVYSGTTLDGVRFHLRKYGKTCCLNFASPSHPGGGFLKGSMAQEESLAYSTTLYYAIDGNEVYKYKRGTVWALYTPDVEAFRDNGLALTLKTKPFSIITSPAYNVRTGNKSLEEVEEYMLDAILTILRTAYEHKEENLVLGAFGCGAFANEPEMVAELFKKALSASEFVGKFKHIDFYIPRDKTGNFEVFKKILV